MNRCWICILLVLPLAVLADDPVPLVLESHHGAPGSLDPSLVREAQAALDRSLQWLLAQQNESGHWSSPDYPALTALPLWGLARSEHARSEPVKKGIAFVLSNVHENGAIYREAQDDRKGGGLSTYNTALAMAALNAFNDPDLLPVVLKARTFIAKHQHLGGDMYRGGMGYDPSTKRAYTDLSNSYIAYEAMSLTEDAEDLRTEGERADLDWEAAVEFLDRVQNHPSEQEKTWASDDPKEQGGFIYRPDASQAGTFTDDEGVVRFRTYGSMTYAGMLSLIYAKVDRKDPRVRSAFQWAEKHWTLDENPGMGASGLYYFYNVLAKSLAAYGRDQLTVEPNRPINWRTAVIRKLIELQKIDPATGNGYWVNEQGRWWEADPILVTSYSVLALQTALGE